MSGTREPPQPDDAGDRADLDALSAANNELMALHRQLAKKEAALRQADERKDALLATVAHDLRNPLSTISGFSQILRRRLADALGDEDELLLERIEAQAERMLFLVDDLVDTAVIAQGALTLDREPVDLHDLLEDVIAIQAAAAARKDITVDLDEPGGPVTAEVDRHRMRQVLDNLLSNAIKYTPMGRAAAVTVVCVRRGEAIRIDVIDEGVGIDPDLRDRLFEPFSRSGNTGTGGEPSTGLGLAIARSIVLSHGGTIDVDSQPGRGSRFRVEFPRTAETGLPERSH